MATDEARLLEWLERVDQLEKRDARRGERARRITGETRVEAWRDFIAEELIDNCDFAPYQRLRELLAPPLVSRSTLVAAFSRGALSREQLLRLAPFEEDAWLESLRDVPRARIVEIMCAPDTRPAYALSFGVVRDDLSPLDVGWSVIDHVFHRTPTIGLRSLLCAWGHERTRAAVGDPRWMSVETIEGVIDFAPLVDALFSRDDQAAFGASQALAALPVLSRTTMIHDTRVDIREGLARMCAAFDAGELALFWLEEMLRAPMTERRDGVPFAVVPGALAVRDILSSMTPERRVAFGVETSAILEGRNALAHEWLELSRWTVGTTHELAEARAEERIAEVDSPFDITSASVELARRVASPLRERLQAWIDDVAERDGGEYVSAEIADGFRFEWLDARASDDDQALVVVSRALDTAQRWSSAVLESGAIGWLLRAVEHGVPGAEALLAVRDRPDIARRATRHSFLCLLRASPIEDARRWADAAAHVFVDDALELVPFVTDAVWAQLEEACLQSPSHAHRTLFGLGFRRSRSDDAWRERTLFARSIEMWTAHRCPSHPLVREDEESAWIRLVRARCRGPQFEPSRSRWTLDADALDGWLASIDPAEDATWLVEPGAPWIIDRLADRPDARERFTQLASAARAHRERATGAMRELCESALYWLDRALIDPTEAPPSSAEGRPAWPWSPEEDDLVASVDAAIASNDPRAAVRALASIQSDVTLQWIRSPALLRVLGGTEALDRVASTLIDQLATGHSA